jgi:membrane dipeptidase
LKTTVLKFASLVSVLINMWFMACHMEEKRQSPKQVSEKQVLTDPLEIHQSALIIDMHADTTQRLLDEDVDLSQRLPDGHMDEVRIRKGGLDAQFFSIWVEPRFYGDKGESAVKRADDQIAAVRRLTERQGSPWELATRASEIRGIVEKGRFAALMGLEGGYALDERIENVKKYYDLGVRYMSPAWSVSTSWAGSSGDKVGLTRGLNEFGRQVIAEMNRLGMMVDVSHVSDITFWDIIKVSRSPVIATHSACRAIANVPRNLDDEQLKALAQTGGVCSVVFYPEFIQAGYTAKRERVDSEIRPILEQEMKDVDLPSARKKLYRDRLKEREYKKRLPAVTVREIVDHIDHIVKLIGIDHVAIGSDFDGIQITPSDLSDVEQLPNLTIELLRRGYTEEDVYKILGGNILRVMERVEQGPK